MPISMELMVFTSFSSISVPSLYPCSSKTVFFRPTRKFCSWKITMMSPEKDSCLKLNGEKESEFVEVMGIGSRKDSLLDFCLDSPLHSSSSLRFWNILIKDSLNVQLQQRFLEKDQTPKLVEASLFLQSCPKAIILVASAGYGSDHVAAIDILKTIRSANGFVVAIILKPFSFEGKRRQDEVKDLLGKLQEHTNFCIDIDTDALLKKDLVTLNEALKTANSAVLLSMKVISILISDTHRKLFDVPQNNVKELKVSEVVKILESYKEAKVGFGAGYNIKSSILQAIYDCPFIGAGVKDLNGIVICVVASSGLINNSDLHAFLRTFRQTTEYTKELVISTIHEPNLEPNLLVTTVVIVGCLEQQTSQKSTILSRLAHHFPFVFNLLKTYHQQSNDTEGDNLLENTSLSEVTNSQDSGEMENGLAVDSIIEGFNNYSEEFQRVLSSNDNDINASWTRNSEVEQSEVVSSDARTESSNFYEQLSEGRTPSFHREPLNSWNLGPGYQIAQEWAKERAADSRGTPMHDNLSIFCLPVGVRPSEELKHSVNISYATQHQEPKMEDDVKVQPLVNSSMSSWGALTDAGFEAMRGFYDTASTLIKSKHNDVPKKQGVLSVRAASMLEAERDSPKKWNPIVEMQYRGGVYRGRCQGGLPEGKGRLILGDGSIYDGTWRYGKRSGLGTFYFSNGDVFQGSWRDDLMHGKGWFYFHTGDRWFANFWKGKADGEGRFYSKSGDVFFGHFQDGWRHGHFLYIDADGARFLEIWNEGVLLSRNQLDSDTGTG